MASRVLLLLLVTFMCLNAGLCRHYRHYDDYDDDDDDYEEEYDLNDDNDDYEDNDEYNDGDDKNDDKDNDNEEKEDKEDDLGDLLDFDPTEAPVATEPPVAGTSAAPQTEAPATEPPATEPPATEPPATEPPATQPPATHGPTHRPMPGGGKLPDGVEQALKALRGFLLTALSNKGPGDDKKMVPALLRMIERNQARIHGLETEVRRIEKLIKESAGKKGGQGGKGGTGGNALSEWFRQVMSHLGNLKNMFGDAKARQIVRDALEQHRRHSRHFK